LAQALDAQGRDEAPDRVRARLRAAWEHADVDPIVDWL